jgi:hypothetical protein
VTSVFIPAIMAGVEEVEVAALPGTALGRLGESSTASPAAWAAAGAAVWMLHDAPLPPWPGKSLDEIASHLDGECEWLITNGVLPDALVTRNRRIAEAALRPSAEDPAGPMALIRACGQGRVCAP